MKNSVLLKVGFGNEPLLAVLAFEVFLAVVPLHVYHQAARLREAFRADLTHIGTFTRM